MLTSKSLNLEILKYEFQNCVGYEDSKSVRILQLQFYLRQKAKTNNKEKCLHFNLIVTISLLLRSPIPKQFADIFECNTVCLRYTFKEIGLQIFASSHFTQKIIQNLAKKDVLTTFRIKYCVAYLRLFRYHSVSYL